MVKYIIAKSNEQEDLNRSCTFDADDHEYLPLIADNLMWRDGSPEHFPETWVRLASYPMGFRPSWSEYENPGIMHIYTVPVWHEKEPQKLTDSRLWC